MAIDWHVNSEQLEAGDEPAFTSMDTLLARPMQQVTRDSLSGVSLLQLAGNYYVKDFSGSGNRLQHLVGTGRFQRELRNYQYFAELGLATPDLVAWGCETRLGMLQRAVLVTREAAGATDLEKFIASGKLYSEGIGGAREILGHWADATRLLHQHGFYHGDLKARNVLIRKTSQGKPELLYFDCPRGYHPPRPMMRHCIVRELGHMERGLQGRVRRADLMYAYKRYRGVDRLGQDDKQLARDALRYYSQRHMTRKRRIREARRQRREG